MDRFVRRCRSCCPERPYEALRLSLDEPVPVRRVGLEVREAKLNREIVAVLAQPDVKEKLMAEGAEVMPSTPEEFGALIVSEIERLGKIARAAKMRVD